MAPMKRQMQVNVIAGQAIEPVTWICAAAI